jgi:hypothetical protein
MTDLSEIRANLPSGLPLEAANAGGAEPDNLGASRRRDDRDPADISPRLNGAASVRLRL